MLEHIVASSLTKHLANSNILFELQHGFREKRSCEPQLVMLVDEIAKNMQMVKQTDLILLDFSKAFDNFMEFGVKHKAGLKTFWILMLKLLF